MYSNDNANSLWKKTLQVKQLYVGMLRLVYEVNLFGKLSKKVSKKHTYSYLYLCLLSAYYLFILNVFVLGFVNKQVLLKNFVLKGTRALSLALISKQ